MVATLPTYPAVEEVFETPLAPINASLRDLSQRVLAAPPPSGPSPSSGCCSPDQYYPTTHTPPGTAQGEDPPSPPG